MQGLKTVINTRLHIRCIVVLEKIALGCGCVPVYQCPACLAHLCSTLRLCPNTFTVCPGHNNKKKPITTPHPQNHDAAGEQTNNEKRMRGKTTGTASDHGQLRLRPPPSHQLTPATASKLNGSKEPNEKENEGAKAVTPPATPPARAAAETTHTQPSSRATNAVTAAAAHHSSRMRQARHATSSLACRTS